MKSPAFWRGIFLYSRRKFGNEQCTGCNGWNKIDGSKQNAVRFMFIGGTRSGWLSLSSRNQSAIATKFVR
ncbi:hypothetical protein QUA32_08550 [Microcoleus sp. Pol14D6]|uniref:hypothetical protein n=1 Tax=unclassified Microcoleus TaxID=2642155 RepID=UPI002FD67E0F